MYDIWLALELEHNKIWWTLELIHMGWYSGVIPFEITYTSQYITTSRQGWNRCYTCILNINTDGIRGKWSKYRTWSNDFNYDYSSTNYKTCCAWCSLNQRSLLYYWSHVSAGCLYKQGTFVNNEKSNSVIEKCLHALQWVSSAYSSRSDYQWYVAVAWTFPFSSLWSQVFGNLELL